MGTTDPIRAAQNQAMLAQLQNVPANIRKAIAQAALGSQRKVLALPYYSTIRFLAGAIVGTTFTVPAGQRTAFNYKIGDVLQTSQGFASDGSYGVCYESETNLLKPNETRSNDDVFVYGISALVSPESDAQITQLCFRNSSLKIGLTGDDSYTIGRLDFLPGGGGLTGTGTAYLQEPNIGDPWNSRWGQLTNGVAGRDNYYRLPNALIWRGTGTGKDTSLNFNVTLNRAVAITSRADRAAAAGTTTAWTKPVGGANNVGTYSDVTFRLISMSVGQRSENA